MTSTARPASAFAVAEDWVCWPAWTHSCRPLYLVPGVVGVTVFSQAVAESCTSASGRSQVSMTTCSGDERGTADHGGSGMLRALGIVDSFAPVILITGHAAKVRTMRLAAAYDCGGLRRQRRARQRTRHGCGRQRPPGSPSTAEVHGITVPDSTAAVPAWHNTTTDAVTIDAADVPASHRAKVAELQAHLTAAQTGCLRERMAELPGVRGTDAVAADRRSADWAEPQPEWGLAGNAAFVIGPRSMTKGLNLRGRVFLHSYEPGLDVDGSTLELLLTAPMVVTQWINNQYYCDRRPAALRGRRQDHPQRGR